MPLADDIPAHRLLVGLWQLSGAHGTIDPRRAIPQMLAYHDAGLTTWDLADHYGPAEEFIGAFRTLLRDARGDAALARLRAFTKWVPQGGPMTRQVVERAVDTSLRRMQTDRLDMLQFHWWDYSDPAYLDALGHLAALRDAGKIRHVALTNFDTQRCAAIAAHGVAFVSDQVQYSLVDTRPARRLAPWCAANGVGLLTYGTLCGGLLTDAYLGRPEPQRAELNTASLRKYKMMVDAWGGWALFQELLAALRGVATRHNAQIAQIAVRAILDRPAVAGAIIGARLGISEHLAENTAIAAIALDAADTAQIEAVLARSNDLLASIGDCGAEYRR